MPIIMNVIILFGTLNPHLFRSVYPCSSYELLVLQTGSRASIVIDRVVGVGSLRPAVNGITSGK